MKLSRRLQKVASYIPNGSRVADIGSDHAYLPTYLIQRGIASHVIAGELNEGPWRAARSQVRAAGLEGRIDVRKGDGLTVIEKGEVDVITIAGMGGTLISKILGEGLEKLEGVRRLVLQPNLGEPLVRRWLYGHRWQLVAETIVKEDGRIYEILVAEKGDPGKPYEDSAWPAEILFTFGPYLLQEGSPTFIEKWEKEKRKLENVLHQLAEARQREALRKKEEIAAQIEVIEEVMRHVR
ncbi:tRNA (adenine(22)-N(1))-methyltransferase TrmK [Bacillaceae bacterium]